MTTNDDYRRLQSASSLTVDQEVGGSSPPGDDESMLCFEKQKFIWVSVKLYAEQTKLLKIYPVIQRLLFIDITWHPRAEHAFDFTEKLMCL